MDTFRRRKIRPFQRVDITNNVIHSLRPPTQGHVTICEVEGELLSINAETRENDVVWQKIASIGYSYQNLELQAPRVITKYDHVTVFRNKPTLPWRLLGFSDESGDSHRRQNAMQRLFNAIIQILSVGLLTGAPVFPSFLFKHIEQSHIRGLAWHNYRQYFTVARKDGVVFVFCAQDAQRSCANGSQVSHVPIEPTLTLSHEFQSNILDIQWSQMAGYQGGIAVACEHGICLWRTGGSRGRSDESKQAASQQWMNFLRYNGHAPVTSVAWSPCGRFLASASPNDNAVLIWDVGSGQATPLVRSDYPHLLRWSPNGLYLLVAMTSGSIRVWSTQTWESQTLIGSAPCIDACWSPDSRYVAFAFFGESEFHVMHKEADDASWRVVLSIETASYNYGSSESQAQYAGGTVRSLSWDTTGWRFAVTFFNGANAEDAASLIALFDTCLKPEVTFSPKGFIRRTSGCPLFVRFRPNFENGALLAACWESHVAFVPMYFVHDEAADYKITHHRHSAF